MVQARESGDEGRGRLKSDSGGLGYGAGNWLSRRGKWEEARSRLRRAGSARLGTFNSQIFCPRGF